MAAPKALYFERHRRDVVSDRLKITSIEERQKRLLAASYTSARDLEISDSIVRNSTIWTDALFSEKKTFELVFR